MIFCQLCARADLKHHNFLRVCFASILFATVLTQRFSSGFFKKKQALKL